MAFIASNSFAFLMQDVVRRNQAREWDEKEWGAYIEQEKVVKVRVRGT